MTTLIKLIIDRLNSHQDKYNSLHEFGSAVAYTDAVRDTVARDILSRDVFTIADPDDIQPVKELYSDLHKIIVFVTFKSMEKT
ncbi:hypothetical protein CHS0354_014674 [Potamilus streckersoni]|uniref:Uncharacterized protein n=1 Tax=Potamilus streckersoni TaxID=2493646 RepID=A0AAE0SPQ4_9BIVA|nr:hypothetical protein CHS0354_014674 [Potamilus streckersoni]